jgi:hypothetical protein
VPFSSCPLHHREYVVSGRIRYAMDDGSAVEAGAGDHLLIEPGHLAEVVGDEACVLLDWGRRSPMARLTNVTGQTASPSRKEVLDASH